MPSLPPGTARACVKSAGAGALLLGILFGVDLIGLRLDFMGFSDEGATSRIVREYGGDIVRDQLALLAVMACFGAFFGLLGAGLMLLRDRARLVTHRPYTWGTWGTWGAGTAFVCHALLTMRHLVEYPQLYSEALYDRGGLRRACMLALTRHTHPRFYVLVALVLFVGVLPRAWLWRRATERLPTLVRQVRARYLTWRSVAHPRLRALGITLLVLLVGWSAAQVLRKQPPPASRPNVLVIAIDSLRADRVFGPSAQRFPVLHALASRSARLKEAHVTVPRTFPSFVTLLTGRYPHHHGIRHMFPSAEERAHIGTSLPAALAEAGWHTAVVSDYAGEIFARTAIGFADTDAPRFDMHTIVALRGLQVHPDALPYAAGIAEALFPYVRALPERADPALLAARAADHLRALAASAKQGQPFFETVFFSTPHFPYASPYPYYQRFVDPAYEGPFLYDKPPLSPALVTPVDARHIQALYDGAVAAVDDSVGTLLRTLAEAGVAEQTIVVVLADHGENLWEDPRAGMGHGDHLIGERATHVPVLIFDPRTSARGTVRARDIEAITRDVDLAPTLAALCGVTSPPTDGVDLAPLLYGERDDLALPAFSETEYWFVPTGPGFATAERMPYPAVTGATDLAADGDVYMRPEVEPVVIAAKHRAIRLGAWKLTYRPTRAGVQLALYDVVRDPDEQLDLSTREPARLQVLRARLYAWMLSDPGLVERGDFVVPR